MRVLLTLLFCGMCCLCAQAGTVTYTTPVGSSISGLPAVTVKEAAFLIPIPAPEPSAQLLLGLGTLGLMGLATASRKLISN
jgi:hypothetical protein